MKHVVCAVRDSAMGAYMRPFFVPSTGMAVRSFSDEVNRKGEDNAIASHPEDYEIWHVADFDDVSGAFVSPDVGCVRLARAKDLVKEAL
ncbi:MAG: nonstructural protein [Microviridae sp.]|nr:MAG: nonstructural protein [Microviridae sp.]